MFLWSLYDGPKKVVGTWELHPPFFLLLACLAVSFSIVLPIVYFWKAFRLWRPKNRFRALQGEARHLFKRIEDLFEMPRPVAQTSAPSLRARLLTFGYKLDKLTIRHPDIKDLHEWKAILPYIAAWAEMGDLRRARSYRPVEDEPRP